MGSSFIAPPSPSALPVPVRIGGPSPWIDVSAPSVTIGGTTYPLGAVLDGVTDDSVAMQNALNACQLYGGDVFIPPIRPSGGGGSRLLTLAHLVPFTRTRVRGGGPKANIIGTTPPVIIDGGSLAGPIIDATVAGVAIENLALLGQNASGSIGIKTTNSAGWLLENLFFNNFGDQAILWTGGAGGILQKIKVQNSVLVRTGRVDYIGAVELSATDIYMNMVELTTSSTANDSGSGFITACVLRGESGFIGPECVFETSETGLYIAPNISNSGIRIIGSRTDTNRTDGLRIAGSRCTVIGLFSYANGQDLTNTYDGVVVTGALNQLVGVLVRSNGAPAQRYGFNDQNNTANVNTYIGCATSGMGTAPFNTTNVQASALPSMLVRNLAGVAASYRSTGLVAAVANAINYNPPNVVGSYRLLIHYRPTATGVSTSVGVTVTYKDSTGAISYTTIPFVRRSTGALAVPPFLNTGADDFYVDFPFEIDASGTNITVSTTGTFTGTTYNLSATLEQVA